MPITRVTRKQIEAANKAREAALKKDETAYGGVFSSDKRAQINLIPKLERLPVEGKMGDLIVIRVEKDDPHFGISMVPELWLCCEMAIPTSLR